MMQFSKWEENGKENANKPLKMLLVSSLMVESAWMF